MERLNTVAIIQARRGSTRLPDKIFLNLSQKPLIEHVVLRLKKSKQINEIVIATTTNPKDDYIEEWGKANGEKIFRGSEENVLERYYKAAAKFKADIVVRVTADDPFKDYRIIDQAVEIIKEKKIEFVCNNNPASFPEGLDVEVLTYEALKTSYKNALSDYEKEHVTQYIHKNPNEFKIFNIENSKNLSQHRWTIDTVKDYEFAKAIYSKLYKKDKVFLTEEIYQLLESSPELLQINQEVKRSDMYR